MNFNVYVDDDTARALKKLAQRTGASRNMLVREAIAAYLAKTSSEWPAIVMTFEGAPSLPRFESYRTELAPADDDPFAPRKKVRSLRKKSKA